MENGSQNAPGNSLADRPWSTLFATFSEHRSLDAFWSTFGTLWLPNGTRMAPKKHCWAPSVCILLASFSEHRLLDAFWSPFGSLLAIFWLPFGTFFAICSKGRSVYAFQSPFCSLWGIFWLPSDSFSYPFGSPLVPSSSLLLTSGFYFLILGSPSVI